MKLVSLVKKFVICGLFFVSSNAVYGYDFTNSLSDSFEGISTKVSNDPIFWGGCAAASGFLVFSGMFSAFLEKNKEKSELPTYFVSIISLLSLVEVCVFMYQKDYSVIKKGMYGCFGLGTIYITNLFLFVIGYSLTDNICSDK